MKKVSIKCTVFLCVQIPHMLSCGPQSFGNFIMRPSVGKKLPMPALGSVRAQVLQAKVDKMLEKDQGCQVGVFYANFELVGNKNLLLAL